MDKENKNSMFGGFVSSEQKKELINFMEENPDLKSGKFTNNFTYKTAQTMWQTLSQILNALPGAKKEWKQWRKTWQDMKSNTKRKNTKIKNSQVETGGGPPIKDVKMTEEDLKIIEILGTAIVEGDPLVAESATSFHFSNDCDENLDEDAKEEYEIEMVRVQCVAMSEVKTRRSNGTGSFGKEQTQLTDSGKAYKNRKRKDITAKPLPTQEVICKCISYRWRKSLFEKLGLRYTVPAEKEVPTWYL
ncbi:unnamed protein product [Diabrotica balteata]|uniref:Regulatory protein zeste n=1 Tax=Diabrotica balteata TaxID=107213 RepID=A0A9N9X8Z3_DIABA|nr:unnamed protein product [Diabrotica balteata]